MANQELNRSLKQNKGNAIIYSPFIFFAFKLMELLFNRVYTHFDFVSNVYITTPESKLNVKF